MSYDPSLGRFLERDPIGSPDTFGPAQSPVAIQAMQQAQERTAALFGIRSAGNSLLWQSDMNSYEFVESNPVNGTDPSGMDRYVIEEGLHVGIAVDTWALDSNCHWIKTGVVQYDFGADYRYWYVLVPGGLVRYPGKASGPAPGISGTIAWTYTSSPQADNFLKANLDAAVVDPPAYSLLFYNCYDFVDDHICDGGAFVGL